MRSTRCLVLSAALLAAACGDDDAGGVAPIPYQDDGKLTVMTRNLYLGADLRPVLDATPETFLAATTAVWDAVNANRFDLRAEAIADEILAHLPDVVALQEVSLWRTQNPGDSLGPAPTPATVEAIDYLDLLTAALARRGLSYVAAQQRELFDVELLVGTGQDVRFTDRQVILVREGIPLVAEAGDQGVFTSLMTRQVLGNEVVVTRGWARVEVTIGGEDVTVYATHLEAFDDVVRDAQAVELATIVRGESGRVVVAGDLNSTDAEGAYGTLVDEAFVDAWAAVGAGEGLTCCWPADLRLTTPPLATRIDHVLVRGGTGQLTPESASVVGDEEADRVSGLWPSDHAGVVATIAP